MDVGEHGASHGSPAVRVDGIRLFQTRSKHIFEGATGLRLIYRNLPDSSECLHQRKLSPFLILHLCQLRQTTSYPDCRAGEAPPSPLGRGARTPSRTPRSGGRGLERSGGPIDLNKLTKVETIFWCRVPYKCRIVL